MSTKSLNELIIHFHTFRNVDLLNQGLYQIRSRIYYTDNKSTKYFAIPYHFVESRDADNPYLTEENTIRPHNIITNYINDTGKEYITKTFLIRYSDEEVDIDEFCYFRIELPKTDVLFHIEFELYFSDALMAINKDKKNSSINNIEFKSVCCQYLLITYDRKSFVQSYMPIIFNDSFSSLLSTSVHIVTLDHRGVGGTPMLFHIEESVGNKLRESNNKKPIQTANSIVSTEVKGVSPINFFLEEKTPVLEKEKVDGLFETHVMSLVYQYNSLRVRYSRLINKLIDDNLKSEYAFFIAIQPLTFYTEENSSTPIYDVINLPKFSSRLKNLESEYVGNRLMLEINFVSAQLTQLWHKYIEILRFFPSQSNYILQNEYMLKYKDDLFKFMKKSIISIIDTGTLLLPIENNLGDLNKTTAEEMRTRLRTSYIPPVVRIYAHK
jgi:hypothetical protein